MAASRRSARAGRACVLLPVLAAALLARDARAQVVEEAVLSGRVLIGTTPLTSGTVVLLQVSDVTQGEIDSTRVAPDGTFRIRLPGLPNPLRGEYYVASVRHQGVMYLGQPLGAPEQLDSLYVIQAYDTLLAPAEGIDIALELRSIFVEPNGATWRITDVFQVRNDRDRTIVARPEGRTWSYPLPATATEVVTGDGEMSADAIRYENGGLVARAAISPGPRMFVVQYTLATPEVEIPTPGTTEIFDVLVREPAPPLDITELTRTESVEFDGGGTYRRFAADSVSASSVVITLGEESGPPPVQWIAVALALVLAAGGLIALKTTTSRATPVRIDGRQELLLQLARLDEDFEGERSPSGAARQEYQQRRAELIRRLKSSG